MVSLEFLALGSFLPLTSKQRVAGSNPAGIANIPNDTRGALFVLVRAGAAAFLIEAVVKMAIERNLLPGVVVYGDGGNA